MRPASIVGAAAWLTCISAMASEFPRTSAPGSIDGQSAPFVGTWSMALSDAPGADTTTQFASCEQPVVIEAADETHIRYLGLRNMEEEPAIELRAFAGRTSWIPIAGGPSYVAVWIDPDSFYLYDVGEMGMADWDWPYIYERCP